MTQLFLLVDEAATRNAFRSALPCSIYGQQRKSPSPELLRAGSAALNLPSDSPLGPANRAHR